MLTLVNILICFFIFLILYQIFLANNIIEGLETEYKEYNKDDPNNALILAQQNAGNINYLKERMDSTQGMYQQVQDLSGNVGSLQIQVNDLIQAQKEYTDQLTGGGEAPEITGAVAEDEEEDTDNLDT